MTIHVILGVGIAVVLNTKGLWFKRFYRSLFILPVVIPPIIVATVWKNMFDADYGAMNQLSRRSAVSSGSRPTNPASTPTGCASSDDPISCIPLPLAFFAMIITNTWLGWPLNSVVATGRPAVDPGRALRSRRDRWRERLAEVQGVTLPFLRPAMLPYAIYGFVITFNLFLLPFFMTQGEPFGRTEILVTQAYRLAYERRLFGVRPRSPSISSSCCWSSPLSRTARRKRRRAMPNDRRSTRCPSEADR